MMCLTKPNPTTAITPPPFTQEISAPIDVVAEMSLLKSELATANRECIEQKVSGVCVCVCV